MELVSVITPEGINEMLFEKFGVKFMTDGFQWGTGDANGDIKMVRVGSELITYIKETGTWKERDAIFTP